MKSNTVSGDSSQIREQAADRWNRVAVFMIMTALNVFNLKYELDTVKKFPENLPSRRL